MNEEDKNKKDKKEIKKKRCAKCYESFPKEELIMDNGYRRCMPCNVSNTKQTSIIVAGLRITEAIGFDLNLEHQSLEYKGLYLLRGKRQKDR
ncbi:2736_t:CDS:2 [Entrophospora sp. SA101]|nr:2736_t:CDS:2 [Entrophospora sp. SA101]